MASDKQTIDGILVTWGEVLFGRAVRSRKGEAAGLSAGARTDTSAILPRNSLHPDDVRRRLRAIVLRRPEVVVKISGNGKDMAQIKNHLDYVSRNGELVLEDQDGQSVEGREAVRDLKDRWRDGRYPIAAQNGRVRETVNIVLSMPPGTDRAGVTKAARDFAAKLFGGKHDYVFATHDDEDHPHVHLVVRTRGYDGKRMNPRKADLQKWREIYAEKLNSHGIEAVATQRQAGAMARAAVKRARIPDRGNSDTLERSALQHRSAGRSGARALGKSEDPFRRMTIELAKSGDPSDRDLARAMARFLRERAATDRRHIDGPAIEQKSVTRGGFDRS